MNITDKQKQRKRLLNEVSMFSISCIQLLSCTLRCIRFCTIYTDIRKLNIKFVLNIQFNIFYPSDPYQPLLLIHHFNQVMRTLHCSGNFFFVVKFQDGDSRNGLQINESAEYYLEKCNRIVISPVVPKKYQSILSHIRFIDIYR